jgi:hypothetical protein
MTLIKAILFLFLLFLRIEIASANLSSDCQAESPEKFQCKAQDSKSLKGVRDEFDRVESRSVMNQQVQIHRDVLNYKKDLYADVYRFLTHSKLDNKSKEKDIRLEIEKTKKDFFALNEILKHSHALEAKLQICYAGNCTSKTRLEFEDQLVALQKMKAFLLIKRPVLVSQSFEKFFEAHHQFITTQDEKEITDSDFEDTLMQASRSTASALLEKIDRYDSYLTSTKSVSKSQPSSVLDVDFNNKIINEYPEIVDDFLERYDRNPLKEKSKLFVCQLYKDRKSKKQTDDLVKVGTETALFIAPFALGPWTRAGAFGLEAILGKKLLQWGLSSKTTAKMILSAEVGNAVTFNSVQYFELKKLDEKCRNIEITLYTSPLAKDLELLNSCREDYHEALVFSSAGALLSLAPGINPAFFELHQKRYAVSLVSQNAKALDIGEDLKNNSLKLSEWAREFKTTDQGHFTYMDLSKLNQVNDPTLSKIPSNYWKYVGEVYSERLNLSPAEIKGFIKSSEEFTDRTKLIINTKSNVKLTDSDFQGGVGVVVSDVSSQLLPLEKSTGANLPRESGRKVAEIVRLVVSKDADVEKLSKSLINQASAVILQDPSISKVFIYTSKLHGRLYKKLGVNPQNIKNQGDRDIVITLGRTEIEAIFNGTK